MPGNTGDHQNGEKSRDGRQNAKSGGNGNIEHTLHDVIHCVALGAHVGVSTLTDDDGVVHDDAQHQDKAEQAQHVDADIHSRHQEEGAHERDRQTHHDPEREFQTQEQGKDQEHQGRTHDQVFNHHVQTALQVITDIRPGRNRNIFRQAGRFFRHPFVHRCGYVQLALVTHRKHLDGNHGLAVVFRETVALDEFIAYLCNVLQQHPGSIGIGADHDVLEIPADVCLAFCPDQDISAFGADGAGGKVKRATAYRLRYFRQGQTVTLQCELTDLDADLIRPLAEELGAGHTR